ncbi:hypothetical protein [Spiroplasma clarkii]|uniref:hypothetical protein n=1 Tax=Spiroplasma clarkii TaxID=2139 RepID=UPI0011BADFD5|nr:hypothetical protein [Spiroplasma clarkii]
MIKKEKNKRAGMMPFLEQQRDRAAELFAELDVKKLSEVLKYCDGKAYQSSWFNNYDWKLFSNLKSQYDSFVLLVLNVEDNSVVPVYYSKCEYKNIYLFMKEIIYSIDIRIKDVDNKNNMKMYI